MAVDTKHWRRYDVIRPASETEAEEPAGHIYATTSMGAGLKLGAILSDAGMRAGVTLRRFDRPRRSEPEVPATA